jgi:excisionase family DNA binding protein
VILVLALVDERRPLPAGVKIVGTILRQEPTASVAPLASQNGTADGGSVLLTIEETADELRLSRRQVERLAAAGRLRTVVIGSARRVRRTDLEDFVASLDTSAKVAR